MYAHADDTKVRIGLHFDDPEVYLGPLTELAEAGEALRLNQPDLATFHLRPFQERLAAAEADVEDLFSELLSIETAEKICSQLYGAIVQAKAAAGRFNGGDGD
jgi:hypothetical protein